MRPGLGRDGFNIGAGSAGYAINTGGGTTTTTTTFGNILSGTFRAVGQIATPGGSTLTFSAAPAQI